VNVLSVCSGAGGMDLGIERAGCTIAGTCEIHPPARRILAHHWPDVPCWDDLTTLNGNDWHGRVDLVAGGTPCTDLSMAGRRDGLGGEHSRLFWDFVRVAHQSAARWVLWENVAGALSSQRGADFASVLWGLSGHLPGVPADGWATMGVCVGVERAVVWRLLDARWFGVAQRRRRVFALGCPVADIGRAIAVLLEPESVCRDTRPSTPPGQGVAALTATGVGTCGADDNQAQAGHLIGTLTCVADVLAAFDSTWSGRYPISDDVGTSPTLKVGSALGIASPPAVCLSENQRGEVRLTDYARSLSSGGGKPGRGYPAVAVAMRGRADGVEAELGEPDIYNALRAGNGGSSRQNGVITPDLAMRRLTPVECERLMGWPDGWTEPAGADSHRYAACGNGVVAPVAEWIGRRLIEAAR